MQIVIYDENGVEVDDNEIYYVNQLGQVLRQLDWIDDYDTFHLPLYTFKVI